MKKIFFALIFITLLAQGNAQLLTSTKSNMNLADATIVVDVAAVGLVKKSGSIVTARYRSSYRKEDTYTK